MPCFVTSDNEKIYYEERRKEKPIIFIHGWGNDHAAFRPVVNYMSKWFRCITYDLRGCGASSRPRTHLSMRYCAMDLKELIEELQLTEVMLVGVSLGATVIYSYVREYGCKYLDRVVLGDMPPRLIEDASEETPWKWGIYRGKCAAEDLLRNMGWMFEDFYGYTLWHVEQCMPAAYGIKGLPPEFRQALGTEAMPAEARQVFAQGACANFDPLTMIAYAYSSIYEDYRDTLPLITVPAAVFYPRPGSIYLPEAMDYVADHITGHVRKVEFSPGTHMFLLEHMEKALAELVDFAVASF
jgi:pimeloyl-ACP methyl ester carboxylesterase